MKIKTWSVCFYHVTYAFQSESHSIVAWMSRTPCMKQAWYLKFTWLQQGLNPGLELEPSSCIIQTSQLSRFDHVSLADLCALMINFLANKLGGESKTPATYKMEFFMTLMKGKKPLTNTRRRFITNVARFLNTPLKLVNIKRLRMNKSYN